MPLTSRRRAQIIEFLTTNRDEWGDEGDEEVLNAFCDEKLVTFFDAAQREQHAITVANAAIEGFTDEEVARAYRANPETGRWEKRTVQNNEDCGSGMKAEESEEEEYEEDEEEEEEEYTGNQRQQGRTTKKVKRPISVNQLPPQLQAKLRTADEVESREKDNLVSQILANSRVPEDQRSIHYTRLMKRSVEDLRGDLALLPGSSYDPRVSPATGLTSGAGGKVPTGTSPAALARQLAANQGQSRVPSLSSRSQLSRGGGEVDEEAYLNQFLASAPPKIRDMVTNALAYEESRRLELIEELVGNAPDNESAERLEALISNMSLDQLEDLYTGLGGELDPTPNTGDGTGEVGYSTQPTGNRGGIPSDFEDVLPPRWRGLAEVDEDYPSKGKEQRVASGAQGAKQANNYSGAAGAAPVSANAAVGEDPSDILPLPTVNWAEWAHQG